MLLSEVHVCLNIILIAIWPGKIDLQFIIKAFSKMHMGGRSFFIPKLSDRTFEEKTCELSLCMKAALFLRSYLAELQSLSIR